MPLQNPAVIAPPAPAHPQSLRTVTVGLLGCGSVGQNVLTLLERRQAIFADLGVKLVVSGVLVRDVNAKRDIPAGTPITTDPSFLNECGIVVEVMGGIDRPLALLAPILRSDRAVVTANKALLAERWEALREHALDGRLYYESAVMAGTPIIGPMSTVLRASRFVKLQAVLNGTCAYILKQMEQGKPYQAALSEAQALGYAETPPTLDVGGFDTAHKLAVLARFCADGDFKYQDISVTGIEDVTLEDIADATAAGEKINLVATLERSGNAWKAEVAPTRLKNDHPICTAGAGRNAMVYEGEECGPLFFAGGGAGGMVTASAIVGDIMDCVLGFPGHVPLH